METKMTQFLTFINDECGATALEYALMIALIAGAAASTVTTTGTRVTSKFSNMNTSLGS